MKYCAFCGNELLDEAVVCPKCGCPTAEYRANANANANSNQNVMATVVKIFMILACVLSGFAFLVPLVWTIPLTVSVCRRLENREPIGVGLKVCTLLFCSLIAGILLLCMNTED